MIKNPDMKALAEEVNGLCLTIKTKGVLTRTLDVRREVYTLSRKAKQLDGKMKKEGLPPLRSLLLTFQKHLPKGEGA